MRLSRDEIVNLPPGVSAVVQAGPGSGKTRLVVDRLRFLVQHIPHNCQIACITYSNAAAEEIKTRLDLGLEYLFIGTIHSFLIRNVLRPYGHMLEDFQGMQKGFKLVPERFTMLEPLRKALNDSRKPHMRSYQEAFENIGYDLDGNLVQWRKSRVPVSIHQMRQFKAELHKNGYLDNQDVLWFARKILLEQPHVFSAICSHFPYIVVDEYQDTNMLQDDILVIMVERGGCSLFMVGDPDQSVYSFAGANPALMNGWRSRAIDCSLDANFRSSSVIVSFTENFCSLQRPIKVCGKFKDFDQPVRVYAGPDHIASGTARFNKLADELGIGLQQRFILTWSNKMLGQIQQPLDSGRASGYGSLDKFLGRHRRLCSTVLELLEAVEYSERGEHAIAHRKAEQAMSRLLFNCGRGFEALSEIGLTHPDWQRLVVALIRQCKASQDLSLEEWLGSLQDFVKKRVREMGGKLGNKAGLLSRRNWNQKLGRYKGQTLQSLSMMVLLAEHETTVLRTIHGAKGHEREAVLVVAGSKEEFLKWMSTDLAFRRCHEECRIGYVGMTRAEKLLAISTPGIDPKIRKWLAEQGVVIEAT